MPTWLARDTQVSVDNPVPLPRFQHEIRPARARELHQQIEERSRRSRTVAVIVGGESGPRVPGVPGIGERIVGDDAPASAPTFAASPSSAAAWP